MIKACIFDLDGTLADTLDSMAHIANEILRSFSLPELPIDNFRYYSGEGATVLVKKCLIDAGDEKLIHLEEMDRIYRKRFEKDPLYKVKCYDGITEILHKFHGEKISLGVCTNKPDVASHTVIRGLFGDLFDQIAGQRSDLPRKPAPDGALLLAKQFGVRPEECMYIGDTAVDMQTGKNAGMYTVGALWGYRRKEELLENHADALAQIPADLWNLYKKRI